MKEEAFIVGLLCRERKREQEKKREAQKTLPRQGTRRHLHVREIGVGGVTGQAKRNSGENKKQEKEERG